MVGCPDVELEEVEEVGDPNERAVPIRDVEEEEDVDDEDDDVDVNDSVVESVAAGIMRM